MNLYCFTAFSRALQRKQTENMLFFWLFLVKRAAVLKQKVRKIIFDLVGSVIVELENIYFSRQLTVILIIYTTQCIKSYKIVFIEVRVTYIRITSNTK